MPLKILRNALGYLIIFFSFFMPIKKLKRSAEEQQCVDKKVQSMTLYQFQACPFCLKTRRAIKRLNLKIKTLEAQYEPARSDLLSGGGEIKVPCLKIEDQGEVIWMYESNDIIAYLEEQFGEAGQVCSETV
ncbi:MAG: glutaredoxin [Gammaproteobacteria bacterium]|nr:glutaredoxin [Gammaproteobacteria bacterium]